MPTPASSRLADLKGKSIAVQPKGNTAEFISAAVAGGLAGCSDKSASR